MGKVYAIDKNKISSLFVLGDIHGDLDSLESLVSKANKNDLLISLGDYADRGRQGVEVIDRIKELQNQGKLIPLKGNHEDYNSRGEPEFTPCDLPDEANEKRGGWEQYFRFVYQPFTRNLYLAAILPGELLFVHGGICDKIKSMDDIEKQSLYILWADPANNNGMGLDGWTERPEFGPDVSKSVCEKLGIKKIIRSHQPRKAQHGPHSEHNERIITTSSTTFYDGKAFALRIKLDNPQEYEVIF